MTTPTATATPSADDTPDDDIDQDCNGSDRQVGVAGGGGCACDQGGRPGGLGLIAAGLIGLLLRRRVPGRR